MSMDKFEFKPVRLHTPHDNLSATIGLVQAQILAADTALVPEVMFGGYHVPHSALETAVAMLVAVLDEAEHLCWSTES